MNDNEKIILIADDIELNRAIIAEIFNKNYRIIEVENGKRVLDAIAVHGRAIKMVLLDIIMPEMDGYEVLQAMAGNGWLKQIPVIIITSDSSEKAALRCYNLGVSDMVKKPFNPEIVRRRVENVIELYAHKFDLETMIKKQITTMEEQEARLNQANSFVIDALSTVIEFRSGESGQHIRRIRGLTRYLTNNLVHQYPEYDMQPAMVEAIASAATMHDIGKIAIPDSVLLKPGKLTDKEFEVMKTHTIRGCEILETLDYTQDEDYFKLCYEICRYHHERWDGKGYPEGLREDKIPIWAQIVSLADVYDALTSERVYKPPYSHEQAVTMILNGECGVFNPKLIMCFKECVEHIRDNLDENREKAEGERLVPYRPSSHLKPLRLTDIEEMDTISERVMWLLEVEQEKYRVLSEMSGEIIFDYNLLNDRIEFSEKASDIFGMDTQIEHFIKRIQESGFIEQEQLKELIDSIKKITPEQPFFRQELRLKLKDNSYEWYELYANAIFDSDMGRCISILGKITNIHERKKRRDLLYQQANTDPLTGLFNRNALNEHIYAVLSDAALKNAAVMIIDLDNFKSVNDNFGHLYGDGVLKEISREIRERVRETDTIGRIGGDEFVVFMENYGDESVLEKRADAFCRALRKYYEEDDVECTISGSIGIACFPRDGKTYDELLGKADQALYYIKKEHKNDYAFYRDEIRQIHFHSVLSEVDA